MNEKKTFGERCKDGWNRHKKKVYIIGGAVVACVVGYFVVDNWDEISDGIIRKLSAQATENSRECVDTHEDKKSVEGSGGNNNSSDDEDEVYGLGPGVFPTCKTCGSLMTGFDGWAWYTCPDCGNKVRIIDGVVKWYDEIFRTGKKQHYSDYELADFCRGGDLSED